MKCSRMATAREANRRSHPRTVEAGRRRARAMRRWPSPRALATSALPIISVPSRRRTKVSSWTSTWVLSHGRQIERRKRRRSVPSTKRTSRSIPCPQGRNPEPQFGQFRRPCTRAASTAASSVPTMITAELRLRQEEPSRDPSKDLARGLLRVQFALTLPPGCPPWQDRCRQSRPRPSRRRHAGHQTVLTLGGARPPVGAQSTRRSTNGSEIGRSVEGKGGSELSVVTTWTGEEADDPFGQHAFVRSPLGRGERELLVTGHAGGLWGEKDVIRSASAAREGIRS